MHCLLQDRTSLSLTGFLAGAFVSGANVLQFIAGQAAGYVCALHEYSFPCTPGSCMQGTPFTNGMADEISVHGQVCSQRPG
jgi:hypothetical protein